jgi:hypothetical protein
MRDRRNNPRTDADDRCGTDEITPGPMRDDRCGTDEITPELNWNNGASGELKAGIVFAMQQSAVTTVQKGWKEKVACRSPD